MLWLDQVVCGYQMQKGPAKVVLESLSCQIEKGRVLAILGSNGIGKTTLFKSVLGALPLLRGRILIDDVDMRDLNKRQIANKIGYVPQSHTPPFPFTVLQIVVMGRAAHLSHFQTPSKRDMEVAKNALALLGIAHLAEEVYTEISGGERQLALIARALVQEAAYLIMDEPTSNLDFGNQIRVLRQIKQLAASGIGVIFTTHYPDHAFLCADDVAVIKDKNHFVFGAVDDVVTQQVLEEIYGIQLSLIDAAAPDGRKIKSVIPFL